MNENILNNLKEFIEKKFAIRGTRIHEQSRIEEDLRITGTDAVELILAFGKRFNVDVSNFMAKDYFDPEGASWFNPVYVPNKKVLTITHLIKAVNAGRLDESVINS